MADSESKLDDETTVAPAARGLGDLAGAFFASVGVTEDRYRAAKAALGLDPKCNCDARKKWLNEMGRRLGVDGVVVKMAQWMDRGRRN